MHEAAREKTLTGERGQTIEAMGSYFAKHKVHPFMKALGEKLIMDGEQDNINEYIGAHCLWPLENIQKAAVEKHFVRNAWRLKPKSNLDEDAAATRIQAGYRGKKSRGRVKKIQRSNTGEYDEECEEAAIKMQGAARGRKSRKRVAGIKHKKEMEAQGYFDEHEAAATKLQGQSRRKRDRKRVE